MWIKLRRVSGQDILVNLDHVREIHDDNIGEYGVISWNAGGEMYVKEHLSDFVDYIDNIRPYA